MHIIVRPLMTSKKNLCDNHLTVVGHIGLIPSYITWTGWRAVGKTADEAAALWKHTQMLEKFVSLAPSGGCSRSCCKVFDRKFTLIMLGVGAGQHADALYLFTEDVCGYGKPQTTPR